MGPIESVFFVNSISFCFNTLAPPWYWMMILNMLWPSCQQIMVSLFNLKMYNYTLRADMSIQSLPWIHLDVLHLSTLGSTLCNKVERNRFHGKAGSSNTAAIIRRGSLDFWQQVQKIIKQTGVKIRKEPALVHITCFFGCSRVTCWPFLFYTLIQTL